MKRKLLLQFADWLEKSRTPFNIADARMCVSQHALRFAEQFHLPGRRVHFRTAGSADADLTRIFDMPAWQATMLFSAGFDWKRANRITRKVAAQVVRKLARTGKVDFGEFSDSRARAPHLEDWV